MTAIGLLLSERERERILARLGELAAVDRLVRERGRQQPPEPPLPLAAMASARDPGAAT